MKKIFLVVAGLMMLCGIVRAEGLNPVIPNPFEEVINWVADQNVGLTCLYDLDKKDYGLGAKWQFFKSKHEWLFAGLSASTHPELGFYASFNLGKLIEKIKGEPLVYLKHLEVGYYGGWTLQEAEYRDGVFLNVIKIEF